MTAIVINTQKEFDALKSEEGHVSIQADLILRCNINTRGGLCTNGESIFTCGWSIFTGWGINTKGGSIFTAGGNIEGLCISTKGGDISTEGGGLSTGKGEISTKGGGVSTFGGNITAFGIEDITYFSTFFGLYKYEAAVIVDKSNKIFIQLGCHMRSQEEWDENFWNNGKEFPNNGDMPSKQREYAYNFLIGYANLIIKQKDI